MSAATEDQRIPAGPDEALAVVEAQRSAYLKRHRVKATPVLVAWGLAWLLGYAALRPRYLVLGLLAALAVIASGGAARLYGVLIDASPALTTFLWLGAEALLCVLLLAALWKTRQLDLD